ncbi:hypothetical protein IC229_11320 [Spirosoma sp. BT702]|uniref:Uncharacterized protein n=1 Tax=Spirosoma profusum TaxID=2771354 RepID=A0A926XVP5_9BACT|nr:hypothetical protein [Spirosoma profusum]MBD2701229.1 hypothetical protein [Spirosoma profusum]
MNFSKVFDIITPLMILAGMGVIMIGYGFVDMKRENNVLQFIFGIPIALGAAGVHFLIRRAVGYKTLTMWIVEAIIVLFLGYVYSKS